MGRQTLNCMSLEQQQPRLNLTTCALSQLGSKASSAKYSFIQLKLARTQWQLCDMPKGGSVVLRLREWALRFEHLGLKWLVNLLSDLRFRSLLCR